MRKKKYIIFGFLGLIILFILSGCFLQDRSKKTINLESIEIYKAKEIHFQDLLKGVTCIELGKNTNTCISDSWKIDVYKNYIYIYSLTSLDILIFDKKGKYTNTIDAQSKGKVEYPVDLYINKKSQELWVIDKRSIIKRYSLSGEEYLGNIPLTYQTVAFEQLTDSIFIIYDGNFDKNIPWHIAITSVTKNSKTSFYIHKDNSKKTNCYIPATLFAADEKNSVIYTKLPLNDTIYISNYSNNLFLEPFLQLNFKGKYLDLNKWPKKGFTDRSYAEMLKSGKYITRISSFSFASSKLFFRTKKGEEKMYYALDIESKSIVKFKKLFDELETETPATSIQGSGENSLYFIFDAKSLLEHYKSTQKKSEFEVINKLLKRLNSTDNHSVLIVCTLK